ncbi:hypothetical protein [Streptomyces lydicus]|uniref:hypothetical protein n=1 Tax=Streptomyces lydicus TaxID=47763 RepID=UPI0037ACE495
MSVNDIRRPERPHRYDPTEKLKAALASASAVTGPAAQQGADSSPAEPSVQAGEVWYSMMGDACYLVLKDGQLGSYAIEVEEHPQIGQWRPVQGEPKVWLTIQQLTQYGSLLGHQDPTELADRTTEK